MIQQTPETLAREAVVRTAITVDVPIDRAFAVFTTGFDSWWPREHHIGAADLAGAVLEPRVGGRWYERSVDGSECDWGRVLVWDPPHHVALSWQLSPEWRYEPDPDKTSRVDVRFVAQGAATTWVELEHSGLERHGEGWEKVRDGVAAPDGWSGGLELFARAARG